LKHPRGKEIQVCSNEGPSVTNGLATDLNFYIVIYREILKKCLSQKLLHQMGQYLAWSITRIRRFKFVQMKSLRSQMAPPQGLKHLHSDIYRELLKKIFFSRTAAPNGTIFSM